MIAAAANKCSMDYLYHIPFFPARPRSSPFYFDFFVSQIGMQWIGLFAFSPPDYVLCMSMNDLRDQ